MPKRKVVEGAFLVALLLLILGLTPPALAESEATLVFHVSEKTTTPVIHIPDVQAVYDKIVALNTGKYTNIYLLPEYNGHEVWADELDWIENEFGGVTGIPIIIDAFGGGLGESPVPQLSTSDITDAMAVANVKGIRISEVISWHIEHEEEFPMAYVTGLLSFCNTTGLKVIWSEWKIDVFQDLATYITGYEGIVTVGFQTNSGDLEPQAGFEHVKNLAFTHLGASVQSWYWNTRHSGSDPDNMPISWLIRHTMEARAVGAELIQFEPYSYFFGLTDGIANENLILLFYFLNAEMTGMETSTTILQTIFAEWLNGPAKDDISWVNTRVDVGMHAMENNGKGFFFKNIQDSNVIGNNITLNEGCGIGFGYGPNGTIRGNYISKNGKGIWISNAFENTITLNTITENNGWAIELEDSQKNNVIHHNNFINNSVTEELQVRIAGLWSYPGLNVSRREPFDQPEPPKFVPSAANVWDDGRDYWSDYGTRYPNASEVGNTGVGNTPYFINENNIDRHPLLAPCEISNGDLPSTSLSPQEPESEQEPFPTWIAATTVIIAVVGAALLSTSEKSRKQLGKLNNNRVSHMDINITYVHSDFSCRNHLERKTTRARI